MHCLAKIVEAQQTRHNMMVARYTHNNPAAMPKVL
jgi:hypothetical protein